MNGCHWHYRFALKELAEYVMVITIMDIDFNSGC